MAPRKIVQQGAAREEGKKVSTAAQFSEAGTTECA
jgi:hypothetical protein